MVARAGPVHRRALSEVATVRRPSGDAINFDRFASTFRPKRSGAQFSGNGETVLTSERYTTKQSVQGGITSVKLNAPHDARYRRLIATNGPRYLALTGANGETIGTLETYPSTSARENGIGWVKLNAPGAPTVENT